MNAFPHLRVTQCWGCLKFGHVKAKFLAEETKCGGCSEEAHGGVRIAEALRLRAVELTEYLNATSLINSWKSRNPLEVLTSDDDFDIICVQEPHHNEVLNARDHPNYALIYPDAFDDHRVSVYIRLSSIPAANICPRPDLAKAVTLINLYDD
ncbi:hypothetical protein B0H14DRAFT_3518134 [Mycena olivaceomarginata]|nr:hypothetical protein B0H14DRAFT_3518134 [Mycena olivaceomarginata]